jgi:hypothetical protein
VASSLSWRASFNCDSSSSIAGGSGGELHADTVNASAARAAPPASTCRLLKSGRTAGSVRGTATSCHCCAGALDAPAVTVADLAAITADSGFLAYR